MRCRECHWHSLPCQRSAPSPHEIARDNYSPGGRYDQHSVARGSGTVACLAGSGHVEQYPCLGSGDSAGRGESSCHSIVLGCSASETLSENSTSTPVRHLRPLRTSRRSGRYAVTPAPGGRGFHPICIKLRPLSWWDLRFPSLGALLEAL